MRVVLFVDGRAALYLEGIKRNGDGSIKTAEVINGGWRFERRDGECLAKNGSYIVSRWPDPRYTEVPVRPEWRGDYNSVMRLAQEQYDKEST